MIIFQIWQAQPNMESTVGTANEVVHKPNGDGQVKRVDKI